MSEAWRPCRRPRRFRGSMYWACPCEYLEITGRSKLKAVYERLGVDHLTKEAAELLKPENCPFFEPVRGKRESLRRPAAILPGSRPQRREATPPPPSAAPPLAQGRQGGRRTPQNKGVYSFDVKEAERLYEQGLNDKQIGDTLGTSRCSIARWRNFNGLPSNWSHTILPGKTIRELFEKGKTDREIARAIGASRKAVANWRHHHELLHYRRKEKE